MTLTFDLSTLKWLTCTTCASILSFLSLLVVELVAYGTDGLTDRQTNRQSAPHNAAFQKDDHIYYKASCSEALNAYYIVTIKFL